MVSPIRKSKRKRYAPERLVQDTSKLSGDFSKEAYIEAFIELDSIDSKNDSEDDDNDSIYNKNKNKHKDDDEYSYDSFVAKDDDIEYESGFDSTYNSDESKESTELNDIEIIEKPKRKRKRIIIDSDSDSDSDSESESDSEFDDEDNSSYNSNSSNDKLEQIMSKEKQNENEISTNDLVIGFINTAEPILRSKLSFYTPSTNSTNIEEEDEEEEIFQNNLDSIKEQYETMINICKKTKQLDNWLNLNIDMRIYSMLILNETLPGDSLDDITMLTITPFISLYIKYNP